ncbi:MAG: hypothetical protein JRI44_01240 [Deltaproteobacteria bacterium]|nr:hypothetical protein [Deltaproteobacteria bacterium]
MKNKLIKVYFLPDEKGEGVFILKATRKENKTRSFISNGYIKELNLNAPDEKLGAALKDVLKHCE